MTDCRHCKYAEWDYCEYNNSTEKWWFVDGCQKDCVGPESECEEFEEA